MNSNAFAGPSFGGSPTLVGLSPYQLGYVASPVPSAILLQQQQQLPQLQLLQQAHLQMMQGSLPVAGGSLGPGALALYPWVQGGGPAIAAAQQQHQQLPYEPRHSDARAESQQGAPAAPPPAAGPWHPNPYFF
jgi:hypothetical protein